MELIGTGKQRSAKTSRILINTQPLAFASWEVNLTGDDLDTVNFESYNVPLAQTFDEGILGVYNAAIRFGGDWDAGTNPYDDPPGLFPRDNLANVSFQESRLDLVGWTFPYIRLRTATNGGQVRGKVTFNCDGKNQGPFGFPTGSV